MNGSTEVQSLGKSSIVRRLRWVIQLAGQVELNQPHQGNQTDWSETRTHWIETLPT